jgi:hypothetical protein
VSATSPLVSVGSGCSGSKSLALADIHTLAVLALPAMSPPENRPFGLSQWPAGDPEQKAGQARTSEARRLSPRDGAVSLATVSDCISDRFLADSESRARRDRCG